MAYRFRATGPAAATPILDHHYARWPMYLRSGRKKACGAVEQKKGPHKSENSSLLYTTSCRPRHRPVDMMDNAKGVAHIPTGPTSTIFMTMGK
jgi:hypothetical protein